MTPIHNRDNDVVMQGKSMEKLLQRKNPWETFPNEVNPL